jgi:2-polyprenyl-3-methyl-5-hydroxy-6-metoxy-1,4-benzoquinol methylase
MPDYDDTLEPSPFLVEHVKLLPTGRVLDVAMGNGRNSIFLAGAGFAVEGVDKSPDAVHEAIIASLKAGVSITATVADLEKEYNIAQDVYDVIICFNYLQRSLIPHIKKGIRPGGMVVYETFIVDQAQFGRPRNPAHLLEHNELLDMFRDFRCLRYSEGILAERKAIASLIAQKN